MAILVCFAMCCLGCIEGLMEYFNEYAYAQVAIYGKSFMEAAKSTWKLIKDRPIQAVINDSLIDPVLNFGVIVVAILTAAAGVGLSIAVFKLPNIMAHVLFGILGLLIGGVECMIVMEVISSGVICIFVCFAEDPKALNRNHPELAQQFGATYNLW